MGEDLKLCMAEIEEEKTLAEIRRRLDAGEAPLTLVDELREGMSIVGDRFENKIYYLPDLVLSAEVFETALEMIKPHLEGSAPAGKGSIVLGTVRGDIHDIGKNIVGTMLRCNGYVVHDLGVDVAPEAFAAKVRETGAGLVALSGLLTLAFDSMKNTVDVLSEAGLRDQVKVIIGGGPVNNTVLDFCGADALGKDPTAAVKLAQEYIG